MNLKRCPFCGCLPRIFVADDEGQEIDLEYARYNGDCDPDVESSVRSWLDNNLDYIAYYSVIACSCGVEVWCNRGGTVKELESNVSKIWNSRVRPEEGKE